MKKNAIHQMLASVALLAILSDGTVRAADQTKADNADALDLSTSWVGSALPGGGDRAIWDGTLSAANCTNSAGSSTLNVGQIQIKNPSGGVPVSITGSSAWWRLLGVGGCALDMSAATVDLTIGSGFTIQPFSSGLYLTNAAGRTLTFSGSGSLSMANGTPTLTLAGDGNYVFSGGFGGAVGDTLIKNGNGAVTFTQPNYCAGIFVLNAGTLNLNQNFAINGYGGSTLTINGGTIDNTSGNTVSLQNNPPTYNWNGDFAFTGTQNLDLGGGAVTLGGNRTVTCNGTNTLTVGGAIGDNSSGYSLTKAGAGTLTLAGASSYTGNTVISDGTLALSGSGSLSSSKILVGNAGTLDVSVAGWSGSGSQSLGNASTSGTGTITNGAQTITLNGGDGLFFQAAGGGSPSVGNLNVSGGAGTLALNNNIVTINVTGSALGATTNTLVSVNGTLSGSADATPAFTGLGLLGGYGAEIITTAGAAGTIVLVVTNTPQVGETTTTTVARTTGANPEIYGSQLDFTATVTGTSTSPTGNVIFMDGATVLATVALTTGVSPASAAVYTEFTDLKVAGSPHAITASYQGDPTHNISNSTNSPVAQTITQKQLTYSGVTADSVVYDGTATAKLGGAAALQSAETPGSGTTSDGIPYTVDTVSLGGTATGTLAGKDVGNQAVTTITGVTLTGAGAGNYSLLQVTGLTNTVTPKTLTVDNSTPTSLTATNMLANQINSSSNATLNGTASLRATETAGSGTTSDGKPYTGDSVSLAGTPVGTWASTNVANNIAVSVSGLSLTGADVGNYTLAAPAFTASILGLSPGDQIRADNNDTLRLGTAWVANTVPTGTNWAIYTGPYSTATLVDSLGTDLTIGGILISNLTGPAVEITGNNVLSLGGVGGKGIDMSYATVDLTVSTARMNLTNNVSINVTNGRTFTFANTISPFAFNLNNPGGSHNLTLTGGGVFVFAGNVYDDPGNAILTMNGTGSCTLNAANYVQHYILNSGTINLGNSSSVGGNVIINGGTINNTWGAAMTLSTSPSFNWNGDFSLGGSDLNLGSGAVTLGGNLQVSVGNAVTVGGAVGDGGAGYSLTKAGGGTLTLSGANTYKGNTLVYEGILELAQAKLATNSTVVVSNSATLRLNFAATVTNTVASLVLGGVAQPAGVYNATTSAPFLDGTGNLLVSGVSAPTPTNITYTISGSLLTLNWPSGQGWLLQSNSVSLANSNAWQTVTGVTPPYPITVNPASPQVFYRLKY